MSDIKANRILDLSINLRTKQFTLAECSRLSLLQLLQLALRLPSSSGADNSPTTEAMVVTTLNLTVVTIRLAIAVTTMLDIMVATADTTTLDTHSVVITTLAVTDMDTHTRVIRVITFSLTAVTTTQATTTTATAGVT